MNHPFRLQPSAFSLQPFFNSGRSCRQSIHRIVKDPSGEIPHDQYALGRRGPTGFSGVGKRDVTVGSVIDELWNEPMLGGRQRAWAVVSARRQVRVVAQNLEQFFISLESLRS
jgi:hypothetical protein